MTYDPIWNGMEVYVSYRSQPTYEDLEKNWQAKITKALEAPDAKPADILPMTRAMLAGWDKVLKLAEEGLAISPLFDDVASIREVRQPLRAATTALAKGDVATARAQWTEFTRAWPVAGRLIKERAPVAYNDIESAAKATTPFFSNESSTAADLNAALTNFNTKWMAGQQAVTQAARNDKK